MKLLPLRLLVDVVKRTFKEIGEDEVGILAAALTYYAVFSIVPLLILIVTIAMFIFDPETAKQTVLQQVSSFAPGETAKVVSDIVAGALQRRNPGDTILAAVIGLVGLLLSASGVFGTLDKAINRAWDCEYKTRLVQAKLISFLMVGAAAAILLLSLLVSAALVLIEAQAGGLVAAVGMDMQALDPLWRLINIGVALSLGSAVLTAIYRTIPRRRVRVREVWPGAVLTALALEILKQGFAFYLGSFAYRASLYGTFGALFSLITWLYLTTFVFLLGAEFTSEYAAILRAYEGLSEEVPAA
jgi:membrane protein